MIPGGGGWWSYLRHDAIETGPEIDRALLRRVFAYGRPYRWLLAGVLVTILAVSSLSVVPRSSSGNWWIGPFPRGTLAASPCSG